MNTLKLEYNTPVLTGLSEERISERSHIELHMEPFMRAFAERMFVSGVMLHMPEYRGIPHHEIIEILRPHFEEAYERVK